jgi:hypothetical protein
VACRVMKVCRHLLPVRWFWFICRFAIIPLAWQVEIRTERWRKSERV